MLFHIHRPAPPLDRFVECVTYYEDYQPSHRKERLLPDGAVEIIVDLTDTPKKLHDRNDHERFTPFRHAWISGMRSAWIVIEAQPGASMAVIRFRPGGAFPILGFSVEGLTDTVDHLESVLGSGVAGSLRDRILETHGIAAKMRAVEQWLTERARGSVEVNPAIEYLTSRLLAPAGLRIQDVVSEVGYSQRHIRQLFHRWVGMSPKQYGRIRRFQHMLSAVTRPLVVNTDLDAALALRLQVEARIDWSDLALAHGYYDHSHLIRDFQDFSGLTPSGYLASFRGLENYLPIDS